MYGCDSMDKDRVAGLLLLIISILLAVLYTYMLYFTEYSLALIKLTMEIFFLALMGVIAWVGYTLLRAAAPQEIEELVKQLEREESESEATGS